MKSPIMSASVTSSVRPWLYRRRQRAHSAMAICPGHGCLHRPRKDGRISIWRLTSPNVDDQASTRVMFVRVQPNAGTRAVHLHRGKLEVRSAAFMDSVTESGEGGGDRRRSRRKCMRRRHVLPAASTTSCNRKAHTNEASYAVLLGNPPRSAIL